MENLAITFEIQKFLLVFFRVAAVIFMVPVFSARMVSGIFKGGLSLLIAYLLFDVITVNFTAQQDPFVLLALCVKEVFIGAVIGLSCGSHSMPRACRARSFPFSRDCRSPVLWTLRANSRSR